MAGAKECKALSMDGRLTGSDGKLLPPIQMLLKERSLHDERVWLAKRNMWENIRSHFLIAMNCMMGEETWRGDSSFVVVMPDNSTINVHVPCARKDLVLMLEQSVDYIVTERNEIELNVLEQDAAKEFIAKVALFWVKLFCIIVGHVANGAHVGGIGVREAVIAVFTLQHVTSNGCRLIWRELSKFCWGPGNTSGCPLPPTNILLRAITVNFESINVAREKQRVEAVHVPLSPAFVSPLSAATPATTPPPETVCGTSSKRKEVGALSNTTTVVPAPAMTDGRGDISMPPKKRIKSGAY